MSFNDENYINATNVYIPFNLRGNNIYTNNIKVLNESEINTLLNNKADLVNGIVPISQLPAAERTIIRGTATGLQTTTVPYTATGFNDESGTPVVPDTNVQYFGQVSNLTFLYNTINNLFVAINGGGVQLGETSDTAYRGDRGKTAYDHSQIVSGNPHNTSKSNIGLSNVDNTSDLAKPISTATQTALNNKENSITAGTTSQYWRGDKTWQTLPVIPTRVKTLITERIPTSGNMTLGTAYILATTSTAVSTISNAIIRANITFDPDDSGFLLVDTFALKNIRIQCDFLIGGTVVDTKYTNIVRSDNLNSVLFETVQNINAGQIVSIRLTATSGANGASIFVPASTTGNYITII